MAVAGARKLPDARTLLELRERGMTLASIAALYGVTEGGVQRALERANLNLGRRTYRDILPWAIAPEHRSTAIMGHIRVLARQRSGQDVPADRLRLLHEWLDWLDGQSLVLNYHPEAPPNPASRKGGFYYMDRRPADEWILRQLVTDIPEGN